MRRPLLTNTFLQVFTDGWCAENRTVKHEAPWKRCRPAPKRVGEGNITCFVKFVH